MMKSSKLLNGLREVCGLPAFSSTALMVYFEMLHGLEDSEIEQALRRWIRNARCYPSPNELRKFIQMDIEALRKPAAPCTDKEEHAPCP